MSATLWTAALALDLAAGEPPARAHPVVLIGRTIGLLEGAAPRGGRSQLAFGVALVGVPALLAALAGAVAARVGPAPMRLLASVWLLKSAFALRELLVAGARVEHALRADDLEGARAELTALVSRETSDLRADEIASAAVESLAENLCDSFVAPLLFYRLAGLPAALAYRAVNTADAMVGYRGHYERLGKAAARLDDLLSYVPARISAASLVAGAALIGADARGAARVAVRDHRATASPNAGWPMSAAAGALGVRLAKRDHYALGEGGRQAGADDIAAARRLVVAAAFVAMIATFAALGRRGT